MARERICGIYKLTIDGKDYVGQSVNMLKRFTDHMSMFNIGTHSNKKMQKAFDKTKNIEKVILERCSKSNLNDAELKWIKEINPIFNVRGDNTSVHNHTDVAKRQRFEKLKGSTRPIYETTTGTEWESINDAARRLNLQPTNIISVLKGRLKSTGGYKFTYLHVDITHPEMKKIGIATKRPIPVNVYEFSGKRIIKTLEGYQYDVDGSESYVLEGVDGEQWPIAKDIFNKTYKREHK